MEIIDIRPRRGLFDLELKALWRYRELLFFIVWRELKVRYKQAAIGAGWAIVQPVFGALIFTVVFGHFARFPSDGVPYSLFAFTAVLAWGYFSEAVRRSSVGLVGDSELIRKIYFPRLIIPVSMVIAPLADFLVGMVVLLVLLALYGVAPTWNIVFVPVFVLMMLLMGLAIGLWLGPLNVRFRDVMHTLPFVLQVWMYASPIVYPLSMVPEEWRTLYSINPMVGVIEGFRWSLLGTARPDFLAMALSAGAVVVLLAGGVVYFRRHERSFADQI